MESIYINRELSALAFNERILMLANDPHVPLLERLRFVCIAASNIDEYFEIRVGGLKEKIELNILKKYIDGKDAAVVLRELSIKAHALSDKIYSTLNQQLLPQLALEKIHFLNPKTWTEDVALFAKHYFKHDVLPLLSPIALDLAHPMPKLFNKSMNFIVKLKGRDAFDRHIDYAIIHVPRAIPRYILLPSELGSNGSYFIHLTAIIQAHAYRLFPGMEIEGCYPFRLTRNSDLSLRDEGIEDLALAVQEELFSRHYGHVVKLEIDKSCPQPIIEFLLSKHHLNQHDVYLCDGPVNVQRFMQAVNVIHREDLNFPPFIPEYPLIPLNQKNIFAQIDESDILLHHPYQSFQVVIDFIRQAAIDPQVLAIKQTLYRTHSNSAIVTALVEAARCGKEVTAVIELRARFDEESNLHLANRLHQAGVLVLYGVLGYKTHAKMTLIVKRHHGKLKRYIHLGTGNYHEETAKRYTDYGLLTCDPDLTSDTDIIFQQLTGLGKAAKLRVMYHAPFTLQKHLLSEITACKDAALNGQTAVIQIKVNALTDKSIIDALYDASNAGVKILLIIRSLCCLKPGIKNLSTNIQVISVLGRFLEHHRLYHFQYDKTDNIYLASADVMERNLYHRIEILFPILNESIKHRIKKEIFELYSKESCYRFVLKKDGDYHAVGDITKSVQQELLASYE